MQQIRLDKTWNCCFDWGAPRFHGPGNKAHSPLANSLCFFFLRRCRSVYWVTAVCFSSFSSFSSSESLNITEKEILYVLFHLLLLHFSPKLPILLIRVSHFYQCIVSVKILFQWLLVLSVIRHKKKTRTANILKTRWLMNVSVASLLLICAALQPHPKNAESAYMKAIRRCRWGITFLTECPVPSGSISTSTRPPPQKRTRGVKTSPNGDTDLLHHRFHT